MPKISVRDPEPPLAIAQALRRRFQRRQRLFGAWMSIGHPEIAAIFARARRDFIGIDLEHTTIDLPIAQQIIRVCHEFRKACLPRIYGGNFEQMRRLLDAGADGIIVPQVASRRQVEQVCEVMWYPPKGKRGFGVAAAHRYGRDFDAYVQGANEALTLMVQIETLEGVEHIEDIITHPAVDAVMVGPYDISGSVGLPGQLRHPRVVEACRRAIRACEAHRKSCGYQLVYPAVEDIRREVTAGFTFLILGSDIFNLWSRSVDEDAMIAACKEGPAS